MGSGAKEDKKLPESAFIILVTLVGSGAKEDKELPASGFPVLVGSGAKEHVLQQPCRHLCTSSSRKLSMAAPGGSSVEP